MDRTDSTGGWMFEEHDLEPAVGKVRRHSAGSVGDSGPGRGARYNTGCRPGG
jgi:hypothetical protein